jgi:hypothetical protein
MASSELKTSEEFVRRKRTTLLFASALIVLAFITTGEAGSPAQVPLPLLGAVSMERTVAVWMLWVGLLYYLAGFVLEARVIARDSSAAMNATTVKEIDGVAEDMKRVLAQTEVDLATLGEHLRDTWPPPLKKLQAIVEAPCQPDEEGMLERILDYLRGMHTAAPSRTDVQSAIQDAMRFWHPKHDTLREAASGSHQTLTRLVDLVGHVEATTARIQKEVAAAQLSYRRLRKDLAFERRFGFWAWQVGGVTATCLVATALGPGALIVSTFFRAPG